MKTAKKAISPIITTVLLVLVAIVLAVIILVWARGFIAEKVSKFIPAQSQDRPINEACDSISLSAAINGDQEIYLINQGDIPVYKIGVRVTNAASGEATLVEYDTAGLNPGQSKAVVTTQSLTGNKIAIVPILIGKSEKKGNVEYNCKTWFDVLA